MGAGEPHRWGLFEMIQVSNLMRYWDDGALTLTQDWRIHRCTVWWGRWREIGVSGIGIIR